MAPPSKWIPRLEPLIAQRGQRVEVWRASERVVRYTQHALTHGKYRTPPGEWRFESEIDPEDRESGILYATFLRKTPRRTKA